MALSDRDGTRIGLGDAAPIELSAQALSRVQERLVVALDALVAGKPAAGYGCAQFGISCAVLEAEARKEGSTIHEHINGAGIGRVEVNALVDGDVTRDDVVQLLDDGYRCLKLKVGRLPVEADAELVNQLGDTVSGRATIRLDANRSWSLEEARDFATLTSGVTLEYIEEPLRDFTQLAELYDSTGWPIALDESVAEVVRANRRERFRGIFDGWLAHVRGFAAVIVVKPSQIGHWANTVALADLAARHGVRVTVSSSLESGVGLRMICALAAMPGCGESPAGLSTHAWFASDVCWPPVRFGATVDVARLLSDEVELVNDRIETVREWKP